MKIAGKSVGKSEDHGRRCHRAKDEQHEREQPGSQNVQDSREFGKASEYEANSSYDRPELSSWYRIYRFMKSPDNFGC